MTTSKLAAPLLGAIALLLSLGLSAQFTTPTEYSIADFGLYCGDGSAALTPSTISGRILLDTDADIRGNIGSLKDISIAQRVKVEGVIAAADRLQADKSVTIEGAVSAARSISEGGNAITIQRGGRVFSDVAAGGNVSYDPQDAQFVGSLSLSEIYEYSGPLPSEGITLGVPTFPTLPGLPAERTFASAGEPQVNSTTTLEPGEYDAMTLTGGATVTFSGPGTYTFDRITNSGASNTFRFIIDEEEEGDIFIHVINDALLGRIRSEFPLSGSAARVYLESHGDGSSSPSGLMAIRLANSPEGEQNAAWEGTLYASRAGIELGHGFGRSNVRGAAWSATGVKVGNDVRFVADPYQGCSEGIEVNVGPDQVLECEETVTELGATVSNETATLVWSVEGLGSIISGGNTLFPVVDGPGIYTLTATTPEGCIGSDQMEVSVNGSNFFVFAGADQEIECEQETIDIFGDSNAGTSATYQWTALGSGEVVSSAFVQATVDGPGLYALTITSESGCQASDTVEVTIADGTLIAEAGPDATINCPDQTLELEGGSNFNEADYLWEAVDGEATIISDPNFKGVTAQGIGTYRLTVSRDGLCVDTDELTVSVAGGSAPIDAGPDRTFTCGTQSRTLNGTDDITSFASVLWTAIEGGTIISDPTQASVEVSSLGTYIYTGTTFFGCTVSDTALVTFNGGELGDLVADAGEDELFSCGSLVLSGSSNYSALVLDIEWSTNDGSILDGETDLEVTIGSEGEYYLTLNSINGLCTATDTVQVIFDDEVFFNVDLGPDVSFDCDQGSIIVTPQDFPVGWEPFWSTEDGLIEEEEFGQSLFIDVPGTYTLEAFGPGGCTASDQIVVSVVGGLPVVDAGPDLVSEPCSIFVPLVAASIHPEADTTWYAGEGGCVIDNLIFGDPDVETFNAYTLGEYIYEVSTGTYCTNTDTLVVTPDPALTIVEINASPQSLSCFNDEVQLFSVISSPISVTPEYFWTAEDGGVIVGPNNQSNITVNAPGKYICSIITGPSCTSHAAIIIEEDPDVFSAFAGPDVEINCSRPVAEIISSGGAEEELEISWTPLDGGVIDSGADSFDPIISTPGLYELTIVGAFSGCEASDVMEVIETPCILPYYPPPAFGKVETVLGSELSSLAENYAGETDTIGDIFRFSGDSVFIEVITVNGETDAVRTLLTTDPAYGLQDEIPNGLNPLIITGKYPIENLGALEQDPMVSKIRYVRPLFPAIRSNGVAITGGDAAQASDFVRDGFGLTGLGSKICVLSDSYNTRLGEQAEIDISNGDLPGATNPLGNESPVEILLEYPYGEATDEGRAMLQIIHDIAPEAELGFRSGVLSEGDLASGVIECQDAGCDVIVDDITFLTSPFFTDGVISQAVEQVTESGIHYFVAAGNFADNAYTSDFNPTTVPNEDLDGEAHDFGGGDTYLSMTLEPGLYTLVLQWEDEVYSLGDDEAGTVNDFDFYLSSDLENEYFGFNRNNIGGDPLEVMPFVVPGTEPVTANILIVRAQGIDAAKLKFIAFRGDLDFNEYTDGSSTIVGQANATAAVTLGAIGYEDVPADASEALIISGFSSQGGTPVEGETRLKPDLLAPNGGNTTVDLGSPDVDGDGLPNFFGTSAAAPHAAGAAALLIQARKEYYDFDTSPEEMKQLLTSTATSAASEFDFFRGAGVLQADEAILSLAAPIPQLNALADELLVDLDQDVVRLTLSGDFFTTGSVVMYDNEPLETEFIDMQTLQADLFVEPNAEIPVFVMTPALTPSGEDGGASESLFIGQQVAQVVTITALAEVKSFGQAIPDFDYTIAAFGENYESSTFDLGDLGLAPITFDTPADASSNVGFYFIAPQLSVINEELAALYDFQTENAILTITKLPLTISPKDTTVVYGSKFDGRGFDFDYEFDETLIPTEQLDDFRSAVEDDHKDGMSEAVILIDGSILADDQGTVRTIVSDDLVDVAFLASNESLLNARAKVSQRAVVSGDPINDTTLVIDLSPAALFAYQADDEETDLFATGPLLSRERAAVSQRAVVSGRAKVSQRAVVSTSALVNSASPSAADDSDIVVVIDEADTENLVNDTARIEIFHAVNLITGIEVGEHLIGSAALLSANFEIQNSIGNLVITQAPLTLRPEPIAVSSAETPDFALEADGLKYGDLIEDVLDGEPTYIVRNANGLIVAGPSYPEGEYTVELSDAALSMPSNYALSLETGVLTVTESVVTVTADLAWIDCGDDLPTFSATVEGLSSTTTITQEPTVELVEVYEPSACQAGVYTLVPSGLVTDPMIGSAVNYVNGPLYVNPIGPGTEGISIGLLCVEILPIISGPEQLIAHFRYKNLNDTPVYIPSGPDNDLSGAGVFEGEVPEVFLPGEHEFTVAFEGDPLEWTVTSWDNSQRYTDLAYADRFQSICAIIAPREEMSHALTADDDHITISPNPAIHQIAFATEKSLNSGADIRIFDMMGRSMSFNIDRLDLSGDGLLDISTIPSGVYLLSITTTEGTEVHRFIKE